MVNGAWLVFIAVVEPHATTRKQLISVDCLDDISKRIVHTVSVYIEATCGTFGRLHKVSSHQTLKDLCDERFGRVNIPSYFFNSNSFTIF